MGLALLLLPALAAFGSEPPVSARAVSCRAGPSATVCGRCCTPARLSTGTGVHARRIVHGLQIDLTIPGSTYPQNALVPATVTARNVSSRPIRLQKTCGYGYMWVEVVNDTGQVAYPPAIPDAPPPRCSSSPTQTILVPGQHRKRSMVVLLRGSHLAAVVSLPNRTLKGRTVAEQLVQGTPPQVIPSMVGPYEATIQPPGPVHGPLYAATFTNCYLGIANVLTAQPPSRTGWTILPGSQFVLTPDTCESDVYGTVSWELVAGWLGQPAAIWRSPDD